MSAERVTAWATLSARGEQTIHTSHGSLGAEDALSSLGGPRPGGAAVAVDVLQAFANRSPAAEPALVRRVTTEDADLTEIASHRLEPHAPVLAALAAVTEHTGHVVMKRPDHR